MEENKTQAAQAEPAKENRVGMIIGIAAIILLVIPMFALYWYFINQAVTQWAPLHNRLMAAAGCGASWGMQFATASWRVMSWLSPLVFLCLAVWGIFSRPLSRWRHLAKQQQDNYNLISTIIWQVFILYYVVVSIGLIMGWGELVLSLPMK